MIDQEDKRWPKRARKYLRIQRFSEYLTGLREYLVNSSSQTAKSLQKSWQVEAGMTSGYSLKKIIESNCEPI